jgi:hypothetical protein
MFVLLEVHMSEKLTQAEADELLNMLKYSLINEINFPEKGNSTEFNVKGSTYKDLFAIRIYRGRINNNKYEIIRSNIIGRKS